MHSENTAPAVAPPPVNVSAAANAKAGRPAGHVRLRTLTLMRWAAVVGQAAALLFVQFILDAELPLVLTLAVVGASVVVNLFDMLRRPLSARLSDRAAALYLAYDILQLSLLLYLTGGLQNPFALLVLAPVTVSAAILRRPSTFWLSGLAILCISALAIWHWPLPWPDGGMTLSRLYLLGMWVALTLGTVFVAAYVASLAAESRRMSDALAATQMALSREQRISSLGALVAAAAHELGSPLSTIAVIVKELARDIPSDSPFAADVDLLVAQSERCRDILARLSRRPEADTGPPFARLPVTALIEAAARPHRVAGIEALCESVDETGSGEMPPMVAPAPEIIHGIGNLVENAIGFARQRVHIVTRWNGDEIAVEIRDDGPGFAANILNRLGDPYLSSRAGTGAHMGLGIFIAKNLLERTGATVAFANRSQGGATVAVRWNRARLEELLMPQAADEGAGGEAAFETRSK